MAIKEWRLVVTQLSGATPLHELNVKANNWMGALRAGRQELSEDGGVPPGASCAVSPDGTVTILDPSSRRRFILTPDPGASSATTPAQPEAQPVQPQPAAAPVQQAPAVAAQPAAPSSNKKQKFQTVAYMPGADDPAMAAVKQAVEKAAAAGPAAAQPAPQAVVAQPAPAQPAQPAPVAQPAVQASAQPAAQATVPTKKKGKFQTVAFSADDWKKQQEAAAQPAPAPQAQPVQAAQPAPAPQPQPAQAAPVQQAKPAAQAQPVVAAAKPAAQPVAAAKPAAKTTPKKRPSSGSLDLVRLTLLMQRDESPTDDNPLTYSERAYQMPETASVSQAEAALRFELSDLQRELSSGSRGQFVNLAVFDHHWEDRPNRPPLVVIEWKDWKGEPVVDYPAADLSRSQPAPSAAGSEDRLADLFEALTELHHQPNASAGLEFVMERLDEYLPCEAASGCLYDINTDEVRFVALTGTGADTQQGTAVPSKVGLLGEAAHGGNHAMAIRDVTVEPKFRADIDGRTGLTVRNQLLHPLIHEGHLVGILQLTNRQDHPQFLDSDINLINYAAAQLAGFIYSVRLQRRSQRPPSP